MTAHAIRRGLEGRSTSLAFLGVVVLGGLNAVAVRIASGELAPLWSATLRFGIASIVLLGILGLTRTPLPRGPALTGSMLYGAVGFAGAFGCIHWALTQVPPASAQTILALVPLLTFLFAVGQGLERFRGANLAGALVAFAGIVVIFGERLGAATPLPSLAAVVAGAACMAESNIIVKRYPKCHPIANNAVAMTTGAAILLAVSLVTGEGHALPTDARTLGAVAYLSLAGTIAVFSLFMYVVQRWTASATSYVMLLMPLVTIIAASAVMEQAITAPFLAGGALVLAGVYVGALGRLRTSKSGAPPASPSLKTAIQPGCA
jgi:drug/metabolite transporter (DMT)-like permease